VNSNEAVFYLQRPFQRVLAQKKELQICAGDGRREAHESSPKMSAIFL
jgi:hypothetical protein